uniref:Uncharacterized protein n=1 Tax=viral metagenome TaxID=1070528 RepID=A0A2V0R9Z5_9ZZZZ
MLLQNFRLLFSDRFTLKIIPSIDFDHQFDYLCEKIRLQQNSKIKPEHFKNIFYALLYVRLNPKNDVSMNIISMLSHLYLPGGFQECISFIPLRGQMYNIKGTTLTFELHDKVREYVEQNYDNGKLLSNASYLSRELSLNKIALRSKFNERIVFGTDRGFLLNSFMSYEDKIPELGAMPQLMYVSNALPNVNVSVAVSLLFGLHCNEESVRSFVGLAGCIGAVEFSEQGFLQNVRTSIDMLFRFNGKDKSSDDKGASDKVSPVKSEIDKSAYNSGPPHSGNNYSDSIVQVSQVINERLNRLEGSFSSLKEIIRKDISLRDPTLLTEIT